MVKFLACLFMVIDHIGCYFFPQLIWLRMIGRISMPFLRMPLLEVTSIPKEKYLKQVS